MADHFEDLGISPELAAGAESLGWDAPSGLQRDALPVIRRGNNVVLYASSGSGVVGAYGLGLLDQLATSDDADAGNSDDAPSPRALVLVADELAASRTADALARLAAPAGLTARAHGAGWTDRPVDLLVLSPAAATAAVRDSALKLEGLTALVIHGADQLDATGQWDDLETMVDIIPAGAQRILVTGRLDPRIEGFIERHVRKAMSIPPRPTGEEAADDGATVRYRIVGDREKAAAVVSLLAEAGAAEVAVVCRSQDRAETLERDLQARGVSIGGDGSPRILVLPHTEADQRSTQAEVISADVPLDAGAIVDLHARGGAILATPRERAHLLRIAKRTGLTLQPVADPRPASAGAAESVRDAVRAILADTDLAADLALVEPLLDEFPAAEVAAAALHLARTGSPRRAPSQPAANTESRNARSVESGAVGTRPGAGAPPPSSATTWTHLFVSVGSRDDLTPGDIVGAMTGEAGIAGDLVGKIDIRESHTTVEVATGVAGEVIQALNGRTLKGRALRVDYDRKTRAPRTPEGGRAPRSGGAPRGGSKGPARSGPRGGGSKGGPPRGGSRGGPSRGGSSGGGGRPPRKG